MTPTRKEDMKTFDLWCITFAVAGLGFVGGYLFDSVERQASVQVPFTQSAFPCEEDELLGYAPEFGPDNVGCIHIDVLKER
ncbi:membrane protein [Mycobacterium phage Kipper29]|uniref:Uncharacterized protein n=4 Tax=Gladiatorvirus TaxID=2948726 RepID=A0A097BXJ6_9CAUD|nr:hypothetical protein AXJ19_gp025 [Mycobacterium phage VohminGhazi]AEK08528.1 hypothetical protein PBI_DAVINCI_85 [Mycobacterium phage DaVinci]AMQ66921.1 hypothetical protein PBI_MCFLY_87 [Mycobacterium phage McFly]AMW64436.1 hypothetical protein PBI_KAZAN_88 [Mycobacterium phage Kazan]AOT24821.1 hypothetical protein PBI_ISIPHIWO_83 [Mycobacterium phage Isiphiwo]AYD84903.1 hypothetical protein SEA_ZULU_90 [Mycobacterium phage Zulu]QDF15868.1 membrane protein [Mycobacterium phage Kipper29]Q